MTFLVGPSIKLVKFEKEHVTLKYLGWINDQDVNKHLCVGRLPVSKEDIGDRNNHNNIMFAIMSKIEFNCTNEKYIKSEEYSEYIGTISLNSIDWINRHGEIGYMIGEKTYWGLGIATEAVGLVSDYALRRLNLNKVEAGVVDGNIGSVKVLEKNGFKNYGVIPQYYWVDGEFKNSLRFYKLQGDF